MELILLVVVALISDIRTCKIKNLIIIISLIVGFLTNYIQSGFSGLMDSLLATLVPLLPLFLFFALRMLGAGDIKLFCAIGAIAGVRLTLYSMAYSFTAGGLIACIIMLANKSFRKRGRYLANYLKTCFLTHSLQPYTDFDNKNDGAKFRFSYAVVLGVVITLITKGTC